MAFEKKIYKLIIKPLWFINKHTQTQSSNMLAKSDKPTHSEFYDNIPISYINPIGLKNNFKTHKYQLKYVFNL